SIEQRRYVANYYDNTSDVNNASEVANFTTIPSTEIYNFTTADELGSMNHTNTSSDDLLSTKTNIIIYSSIMATLFLAAISRSMLHYIVCIHSSQNIHDKMFDSLVNAPMHFFAWNPAGRILNRYRAKKIIT
ncbi:UNVERIFIED_CONTAM: hypothetical protein B566_EDAN019294, partial [Ephemera danica]